MDAHHVRGASGLSADSQSAHDDRHVQHEAVTGVRCVPADLFTDPTQAVAHRVGVYEQVACGGLQAPTQCQVGGHRTLEGVAHFVEGCVYQMKDLLAGKLVAGQEPLGEEVIGMNRVGGLGPPWQGSQPRQG